MANPDPTPDRPVGPCITSVLDLRDQDNPLDGFVIEDCAVPAALAPIMLPMMEHLPGGNKLSFSPVRTAINLAGQLASWVFGSHCTPRSMQRTQVYLVMSHDSKSLQDLWFLLVSDA